MRIAGKRVRRTRRIQTTRFILEVDNEAVIPSGRDAVPHYEMETVEFLRELEARAQQGDIDWLKRGGVVVSMSQGVNDAEAKFKTELKHALDKSSKETALRIWILLEHIPEKARSLYFLISPNQDGEGTFSIWASVDGPDFFYLNKPINDLREILSPRCHDVGVEPETPRLDPFCEEFEVGHAVVDTVAMWLTGVWKSMGNLRPSVPVNIYGADGFGTITPVILHS